MGWIILYGTVFAAYGALFFLSRKTEGAKTLKNRKPFERMAAWLYDRLRGKGVFRESRAEKDFAMLHPGVKTGGQVRAHYINKISLALVLLFIGDMTAICCQIVGQWNGVLKEGTFIDRNPAGSGDIEAVLEAEIQEKNSGEGSEETAGATEQFTVTVRERGYGKDTVKRLAAKAAGQLSGEILGNNVSAEEIRSDMNLVQSLEGYPFLISWESSNYERIYSDGTVRNDDVKELGETVQLTAVLSYEGYKQEQVYTVRVCPPQYSPDERRRQQIDEALRTMEEESRREERLALPSTLEGMTIRWREKKENGSRTVLLLLGAAAVLSYLLQDSKLHEKALERDRQILRDYPALVSKLTLYMGAGMTIRNAFQRIADNYARERSRGAEQSFVYEEMLLSCHELGSGISESTVYERFGRRCRLPPYIRLAGLLVQNLKKGSNRLTLALKQEAQNAFEERKNRAKKLGEEAGTKLLFPMMLMLGVVMILIMIPAYYSFSI